MWNVYAKPPFGGPEQVLAYLGGYTHRVAISNHRLINAEDQQVTFRWKDYRDEGQQKIMTLKADEFIRRFLLHVLPPGMQRIRHFGFFGNRVKKRKLALCRTFLQSKPAPARLTQAVDYRDRFEALTGKSLRDCPSCETGKMKTIATWLRPPRRKYFNSS